MKLCSQHGKFLLSVYCLQSAEYYNRAEERIFAQTTDDLVNISSKYILFNVSSGFFFQQLRKGFCCTWVVSL